MRVCAGGESDEAVGGPRDREVSDLVGMTPPFPLGPVTADSVTKVPSSYGRAFSVAWPKGRARLVLSALRRGARAIVGLRMKSIRTGEFYRVTLTGTAVGGLDGAVHGAPVLATLPFRIGASSG